MDLILELFEESISDEIFGRSEKREIKSRLKEKNLSKREIDFIRSQIFDIAFEKINEVNNKNIVLWLENANKALNIKHKEASDDVEIYFSPGAESKNAIIKLINNCTITLDICVFTISDNEITRKIIEAHNKGIKVRIITDNDKIFDKGSDIEELARKGIAVKVDYTKNHMHHKFAIMDNEKTLTGSYNWTRSAELYNHENVIVLSDKGIVRKYKNEFERLWKEMKVLK